MASSVARAVGAIAAFVLRLDEDLARDAFLATEHYRLAASALVRALVQACGLLGLRPGSNVRVAVESATDYHGPAEKTLKRDREPSPVAEMADWMRQGERIRVTVWTSR